MAINAGFQKYLDGLKEKKGKKVDKEDKKVDKKNMTTEEVAKMLKKKKLSKVK